jgi:two-component system response regulator HupR/HoxA
VSEKLGCEVIVLKNSVLFVDDEPLILGSIRRAVVDENYVPYFTGSAQEALAIMEKTNISVVVTDLRMPTMDGIALLKIAKEKYPDMQKIVLSGYAQLNQVLASINEGDIQKYITKPWEMGDLLRSIREAVAFYNLIKEKEELTKALESSNNAYKNVFKMMDTRLGCFDKDFSSIKEIIMFTFSKVKDPNQSKAVIDLCERLCLAFVNATPSYPVVFNLQEIEDGIFRVLSQVAATGKLTIEVCDIKCHGNFHFLIFLFEVLAVLLPHHILGCKITGTVVQEEVIVHGDLKVDRNSSCDAIHYLTFLKTLSQRYDHVVSIINNPDHMLISLEKNYIIQA